MVRIPGKLIPDSSNLPDGVYLLRVEGFDVAESYDGYLQFKAQLRVEEPKSHKGLPHFEQWTIGHVKDPNANDDATWKRFPATCCKQFVTRAGASFDGDPEDVAAELRGQRVMGRLVNTINPAKNRDGTPNPYAGETRCQVKDWYEPGEKDAALSAVDSRGPSKARTAPKRRPDEDDDETPAPKRATKPASIVDEDDDDDEVPTDDAKEERRPSRASKSRRDEDDDE